MGVVPFPIHMKRLLLSPTIVAILLAGCEERPVALPNGATAPKGGPSVQQELTARAPESEAPPPDASLTEESLKAADEIARNVQQSGGEIERDAAGRIVAVDLASDRVSAGDAEVELLSAAAPTLKTLRLAGAGVTGSSARPISQMANLATLALRDTQIDDGSLAELARLEQLSSLTLQRNARLTDAGLTHLKRFSALEHLALLDSNFSGEGLAALAGLARLKSLDLRGSGQIDAAALARLPALPSLRVLKLGGYAINDEALAVVRQHTGLVSLAIEDCAVSDAGLAHLETLKLEDLTIFRCYGLSDEGLAHLAGFNRLTQLSLRDTPISSAGLARLGDKPRLRTLNLSETMIGDEALQQLPSFPQLARLELRQTQVSDTGLKKIGRLGGIEYLNLDDNGLTDAGVADLGGLKKLRTLDLSRNGGITDRALDGLAKLPELASLRLTQTSVTAAGAERLQQARPGLRVEL